MLHLSHGHFKVLLRIIFHCNMRSKFNWPSSQPTEKKIYVNFMKRAFGGWYSLIIFYVVIEEDKEVDEEAGLWYGRCGRYSWWETEIFGCALLFYNPAGFQCEFRSSGPKVSYAPLNWNIANGFSSMKCNSHSLENLVLDFRDPFNL